MYPNQPGALDRPLAPEYSLASRPLLMVFAIVGAQIVLGLLYPSSLAAKTFTLLGLTMVGGLVGAWQGRNIRGGAMWAVFIGAIVGMIALGFLIPHLSLPLLVCGMMAFGWLIGLMIGPALLTYTDILGAETVSTAFAITAAVMVGCASIAMLTSFHAGFGLEAVLFIGLLALVVIGLIGMFRGLSERVSKAYSLLGMAIFTGYFLFDFARIKTSEQNTWNQAAFFAMKIYLDFVNFLLFLLRFLAHSRHR
jgi:FtsH-binding integral membrane protein